MNSDDASSSDNSATSRVEEEVQETKTPKRVSSLCRSFSRKKPSPIRAPQNESNSVTTHSASACQLDFNAQRPSSPLPESITRLTHAHVNPVLIDPEEVSVSSAQDSSDLGELAEDDEHDSGDDTRGHD